MYTVKKLIEEQEDLNPIYLNAGDNFQGTLWYNIGRWNVTKEFLNMLPADAMVSLLSSTLMSLLNLFNFRPSEIMSLIMVLKALSHF